MPDTIPITAAEQIKNLLSKNGATAKCLESSLVLIVILYYGRVTRVTIATSAKTQKMKASLPTGQAFHLDFLLVVSRGVSPSSVGSRLRSLLVVLADKPTTDGGLSRFMATFKGIEYYPRVAYTRISDRGNNYRSDSDFVTSLLRISDCEIRASSEYPGSCDLSFDSIRLKHLSDEELLKLVKEARLIANLISSEDWMRHAVTNADSIFKVYSLKDIQVECQPSADFLTENQAEIQSADLADLLNAYQRIVAGEHPASGYVYCLSDNQGHYKIGMARELNARIKQLSALPPFGVSLVAVHHVYNRREYEAALHWFFREKRLRGEWFALTQEDVEKFTSGAWRFWYEHEIEGGAPK